MVGGFEPGSDIRDDLSQAGSLHEDHYNDTMESTEEDSSSLLPPQFDDPSSLMETSDVQDGAVHSDEKESQNDHPAVMNTVLEEQEMNKKLTEFESSFLPEASALSVSDQTEESSAPVLVDEVDLDVPASARQEEVDTQTLAEPDPLSSRLHTELAHTPPPPPTTTSTGLRTPDVAERPHHEVVITNGDPRTTNLPNTSALEQMSSSPTAARTVSRVQSLASLAGYETAAERDGPESPTIRKRARSADPDATPRKDREREHTWNSLDTSATIRVNVEDFDAAPLNVTRRRPQYLSKRSSNARLSYDSMTSSTTETSEATLGADFALQSGGAAPESFRLRRKPNMTLSRSTSLGSLASGVSNMSGDGDDEDGVAVQGQAQKRLASAGMAPELSTLEEESPTANRFGRLSPGTAAAITPRASSAQLTMPTESAIANHVRDIEVPDTVLRQFQSERSRSPTKNPLSLASAMMTPGPKKGLTLKEHRSTVDKLGKENFDLKMKIHFLDEALQKRSGEGYKDMITENVQLKSDRLRLEKEIYGLKKQVRELQRKLDETTGSKEGDDQGYGTDDERSPTVEEEVLFLRERVETSEIEIDRLQRENIAKESEKRRLAEMVRNLGDSRAGASEVGSREERDMWKDMLEAETIAREQVEDDARKLRDELAKLRQETSGSGSRPNSKLRVIGGSVVSRSSSVDGSKQNKVDLAELERLRHECSELQKTIGAQASALTSRNKEKEMLYQEIENLKLGRMGGIRSVAGDSILDRSASRARSNSRASNGTRYTRMSDNERETMEIRIDELRDEASKLKLENTNLQNQLDATNAEFDAMDVQYQADADQFNEELRLITQERDNALQNFEARDQDFNALKLEAQEEIDGIGDELDAKVEELVQLQEAYKLESDKVSTLSSEVRSLSEAMARIEEDSQQNYTLYQTTKADLEDANRDLETLEKNFREAQSKNERLTVQQESSRNEIAFLREEQDGDKIKIGNLESTLKKTHLNLDAERDRARELERRLTEERQQREAVAGQEKQEVQRVINELNREASNSKNELRQTRKALNAREVEVNSFRDRLAQLEDNLRGILGVPEDSHLISAVSKLSKELDQANMELDMARSRLDEHKKLLAERDMLLEESALDVRRLEESLERERLNRRQDQHSFEQALKSHEQASRLAGQTNARIAELEKARVAHRQQLSTLEAQYKDQLAERNQVLLTIWRKLSAMCGPDWAHNHSLINGNLPSQEVIGNMLFWPGFSRNLLLAAKQVEGVLSGFREKIKGTERELYKNYNNVEKELETKFKKLERIEQYWEQHKLKEREIEAGLPAAASQASRAKKDPDMRKLRNENKLLKAELKLYQDSYTSYTHGSHASHFRAHERERASRADSQSSNMSGQNDGVDGPAGVPQRSSSMRRRHQSVTLSRNNSSNTGERVDGATSPGRSNSVHSGRNSGFGYHIGNPGTALAASASNKDAGVIEDVRRSLVVPGGPSNFPANGNFGVPPQTSHSNAPSDGTVTAGPTHVKEEGKWIHRLRELERRLKTEREQRLVDRSGMRQRLEERDAVNEELRRELERERAGRGWKQDQAAGRAKGGYLVGDEPMLEDFVNQIQAQQQQRDYQYENDDGRQFGYDGQYEQDEDPGLRTSEEDRLMGHAQSPTVGSSHAQRMAQKAGEGRPGSVRAVSRGSIMSASMVSPNKRLSGSIKEKIVGRSMSNQTQFSGQSIGNGDAQGMTRQDSTGESVHAATAMPANGGAEAQNGKGMRQIMRTASAMAGVS